MFPCTIFLQCFILHTRVQHDLCGSELQMMEQIDEMGLIECLSCHDACEMIRHEKMVAFCLER